MYPKSKIWHNNKVWGIIKAILKNPKADQSTLFCKYVIFEPLASSQWLMFVATLHFSSKWLQWARLMAGWALTLVSWRLYSLVFHFSYATVMKLDPLRIVCFVWFDSLRTINNLLVKQGRVFLVEPVLSLDKCLLLKDHNAVTPVRLEPAAPRSSVKHSTTEPLRSRDPLRNTVKIDRPTI